MFTKLVSAVVGLAIVLPLAGCADVAANDEPDEGSVAATSQALSYSHVYDVIRMDNGVYRNLYNEDALYWLGRVGMPLVVEEWCKDHPTYYYCTPTASNPRPVVARVKFGNETWGAWKWIPDFNEYTTMGTMANGGNVLTPSCRRLDIQDPSKANNWYCTAGTGGPGWSVGFYAKYGEGS